MQTQQQGSLAGDASVVGRSLFDGYVAPSGYDELVDANGQLRGHWQRFAGALNGLGAEEVARRWSQAQRLIHENGLTFGTCGLPNDKFRPWELNSLPLVLLHSEWETLAAGLQQRARLLELVLTDLHGPKHLIRDKTLPPDVLFAHPGFHRELYDLRPSLGRYLHSYAADLGRGPDGQWWLLADRTEAPSGAGFALENRVITSRTLPEAFRSCHVHRVARYFMAIQETCQRIAPRGNENPRIVMLSGRTSGDLDFEDAYLSRYLGCTLVQGADLVVSDRRVWLKTLGGLYPIDVIIRRPNTSDSDSLELPTDSAAAVAGLADAVRAGNVAITNPFGSGLVESPIFMAYTKTLCQRLLGEDLLLPSVATWWCGESAALDHVLKNLDRVEIKRAFRRRGHERVVTEELWRLPSGELADRIRRDPRAYVAQERLIRSSVPNLQENSLSASHLALRAFMHASGDSFEVMPGGLARTSDEVGTLELSLVSGEGSKDTWIQDVKPPPQISLLSESNEAVELRRVGDDLPSRVADDVYWLGRQIERADFYARVLRAVTDQLTDEKGDTEHPEMQLLLRTMADQGQIEPGFVVEGIRDQLPKFEKSLPPAVLDGASAGSLRSVLSTTFAIGSRVRDRLSPDSWRVLVRIDGHFRRPDKGTLDLTDLFKMSSELIIDLAAFIGMISESMTRSQAFLFMDLGVRLERAWQTTKLLSNCFDRDFPITGEVLETLLQLCDSLMTYRYRYLSRLRVVPVLDLLMADPANPRSILYQMLRIQEHFDHLPRTDSQPLNTPEQRLLLSSLYAIQMLDIESAAKRDQAGNDGKMQDVLERLEIQLPQLSQTISNKYMTHAGPAKLLSSIDLGRMQTP